MNQSCRTNNTLPSRPGNPGRPRQVSCSFGFFFKLLQINKIDFEMTIKLTYYREVKITNMYRVGGTENFLSRICAYDIVTDNNFAKIAPHHMQ